MRTIRDSSPLRMGAARKLRETMTAGERILWNAVRGKRLGFRVRSQYSAGGYILDFYIHVARLAIEIDGPGHDREHDEKRDGVLGEMGVRTIRIPWTDLPNKLQFWLEEIKAIAEARIALQPERTKQDIAELRRASARAAQDKRE